MSSKAVTFTEEEPSVFQYEQTELPEVKKEMAESEERKKWFMNFMSISMGIRDPEPRLEEVSFEGVAKYIADGKCTNIITMVGAGISTSAGIPDYRSPGTGLFDLLKDKYSDIESVMDLFNIQYFMKNPRPFFERSKRFFEISLKPTPCHYFIRLLNDKGLLLRHYTQNIDTLDRLAGLPDDKVVEAHGSYWTSHCLDCGSEYSFQYMEERVLKDDSIPRCEEEDCTGVIKPDIVMFGESLSPRFGRLAEEDTLKCDLLLIMGTALAVQPFSNLTSKVWKSTPRLYINLDRGKTGTKHPISDLMFGGGFDFDSEVNVTDVFKPAKCDDACYEMADLIGFGDELRSLVTSEYRRIDQEELARGKIAVPAASIGGTDQDPTAGAESAKNGDHGVSKAGGSHSTKKAAKSPRKPGGHSHTAVDSGGGKTTGDGSKSKAAGSRSEPATVGKARVATKASAPSSKAKPPPTAPSVKK